MGLLKGNMAVTRFVVTPTEKGTDASVESLTQSEVFENAFRYYAWDDTEVPRDGVKRGWVHPSEPTDGRSVHLNPGMYGFSLREDKININATFKRIAIRQAEKNRLDALEREKLSREERRAIKEAVLEDLARRALPTVSLVDLVYDPKGRILYVLSTSSAQTETAAAYFAECFGVRLTHRESPLAESSRDFLLWLWMQNDDGKITVEDRLTLTAAGTGEKMIVVGEDPAKSADAGYGLSTGKRPSELRFMLDVDDHEFKLGLVASGDGVVISRLGAPRVAGKADELLDERWGLLQIVLTNLDKLEEKAAEAREDEKAWERKADAWISEQLGA